MAYSYCLPNSFPADDTRVASPKIEDVLDHDVQDVKDSTIHIPSHFQWRAGFGEKLLLLGANIVSILVATVLLQATVMTRSSTGYLLSFVVNNRATTQIIVSMIAANLAWLNVYTVTRLISFTTRIHLRRQSLSLNMIAFIRAISTKTLVFGLSATFSASSVIMVLLFAIPTVLWTGALTPVLTNATRMENGVLKIPQYAVGSNETWSNKGRIPHNDCNTVTNQKGIFSDCPVDIIQSGLLRRATQATSSLTQTYTKDDNSHYSYIGRSYGVGSPVGLVDENLYGNHGDSRLLSYQYMEPGYYADVNCFHNASSDFRLRRVVDGKPVNGIPYVYYALGAFPNAPAGQGPDFFAVVGLDGDQDIAVVAAKRYAGRNVILMTAGSNYINLNQTQCEVSFTPTMFTVHVYVDNKLISVLPMDATKEGEAGAPSFDPTAGLATTVMHQINNLGMISTTLYTSVIGDALMSNIRAAIDNANNSISSSSSSFSSRSLPSSSPTALVAVADSFSAMLDSLLVFIGSSQFFVPASGGGDFTTVQAQLTVLAVRIGDAKYVFMTFGMCVELLVGAVEACRTRGWRNLPRWDFADTTDLVLASAIAGEDVVGEMCRGVRRKKTQWTGGGFDSISGEKENGNRGNHLNGDKRNVSSGFRLRLGKKVSRMIQTRSKGEETHSTNAIEDPALELTAISLWTKGAMDVLPLD